MRYLRERVYLKKQQMIKQQMMKQKAIGIM